MPFNYGHTAFIYNDTLMENPPESFDALLAMPDDVKIVIQDPRTSISGLALVLWVEAIYGDKAQEAWTKLAPKILTVTKDWSSSYGMFTDGEADMVLSYTTSPAYHMFAEDDFTKHAAIFPEGHYFMVETVAKVADTKVPELADQFMAFVMSETFQRKIPTANWSLPAALPQNQWPEGWAKLDLPETPLLLLEFHGSDAGVAEQAETFGMLAEQEGGTGYQATGSLEERNKLWQARHDAYWAMLALRPGCKAVATDVCVPISRLAEAVTAADAKARELDLIAPVVGHAGDGNFHASLLLDMDNADEVARAERFISWLNEMAISMDGTCTGEHGVGQGKRPYLLKELGPEAVSVMGAIKVALDPDNIMNPGKILPA